MKIKLLAFGRLAEITGKTNWEISGVRDTEELIEILSKEFPELQLNNYAVAVNKEIIHSNTALKESDTVALLPPYSGG